LSPLGGVTPHDRDRAERQRFASILLERGDGRFQGRIAAARALGDLRQMGAIEQKEPSGPRRLRFARCDEQAAARSDQHARDQPSPHLHPPDATDISQSSGAMKFPTNQ
jgi:hypothetical protein